MNQIDLIRRAWRLTWRHKVLWIFGFLLALTGSSGGWSWSGNSRGFGGQSFDGFKNVPGLRNFDPATAFRNLNPGALIGILVPCCCLLLLVGIAAAIVNYVARAAVYRMVDEIEATGAAPDWRAGLRLGWSNRTFRLFLLDLVVAISVAAGALIVAGVAVAPLLLLGGAGGGARLLGIILTVLLGLVFLVVLLFAVLALSVLSQFWSREIVLRDLRAGQAVGRGLRDGAPQPGAGGAVMAHPGGHRLGLWHRADPGGAGPAGGCGRGRRRYGLRPVPGLAFDSARVRRGPAAFPDNPGAAPQRRAGRIRGVVFQRVDPGVPRFERHPLAGPGRAAGRAFYAGLTPALPGWPLPSHCANLTFCGLLPIFWQQAASILTQI